MDALDCNYQNQFYHISISLILFKLFHIWHDWSKPAEWMKVSCASTADHFGYTIIVQLLETTQNSKVIQAATYVNH